MQHVQKTLHEYRITLAHLYGPGTPGHTNLVARQGHYIQAEDPFTAVRLFIRNRFGMKVSDRFDVEYWRPVRDGYSPTSPECEPVGRYYVAVCPDCGALTKVWKDG